MMSFKSLRLCGSNASEASSGSMSSSSSVSSSAAVVHEQVAVGGDWRQEMVDDISLNLKVWFEKNMS